MYETKCYNSLKPSGALGHGSSDQGGKPSAAEGHYLAFGCCAEQLRWEVHGCKERGAGGPLITGDPAPRDCRLG